MLRFDLDRYYTPQDVARRVVEAAEMDVATRCLDSTCGDGSLLKAAKLLMPNVICHGMDSDDTVIARLRRRQPEWVLSTADALAESSWRRAHAARRSVGCELALLNPPFSMEATKGITAMLPRGEQRCSVAMAHIMTVLERATPSTCCAIVPESLLYSELDSSAREAIGTKYHVEPIAGLRNSTFRGTRANAVVVRLRRRTQASEVHAVSNRASAKQNLSTIGGLRLVRGGLPVFEAERSSNGMLFIHSTDLANLSRGWGVAQLERVKPIARGQIDGWALLLPRVGVPVSSPRLISFASTVQLSDCVIALCFDDELVANQWQRVVTAVWPQLQQLYRGTGARFVTVGRLRMLLGQIEEKLRRAKPARPTGVHSSSNYVHNG
jgi:hypothetical protein